MPEPWITLLLLTTGVLAGMCNAIAGGGTFFTFPAFLASGIPPVVANASNAVAVWPGHALAVVGYRRELSRCSVSIVVSIIVVLSGGVVGALLLTYLRRRYSFLKAHLLTSAIQLSQGSSRFLSSSLLCS